MSDAISMFCTDTALSRLRLLSDTLWNQQTGVDQFLQAISRIIRQQENVSGDVQRRWENISIEVELNNLKAHLPLLCTNPIPSRWHSLSQLWQGTDGTFPEWWNHPKVDTEIGRLQRPKRRFLNAESLEHIKKEKPHNAQKSTRSVWNSTKVTPIGRPPPVENVLYENVFDPRLHFYGFLVPGAGGDNTSVEQLAWSGLEADNPLLLVAAKASTLLERYLSQYRLYLKLIQQGEAGTQDVEWPSVCGSVNEDVMRLLWLCEDETAMRKVLDQKVACSPVRRLTNQPWKPPTQERKSTKPEDKFNKSSHRLYNKVGCLSTQPTATAICTEQKDKSQSNPANIRRPAISTTSHTATNNKTTASKPSKSINRAHIKRIKGSLMLLDPIKEEPLSKSGIVTHPGQTISTNLRGLDEIAANKTAVPVTRSSKVVVVPNTLPPITTSFSMHKPTTLASVQQSRTKDNACKTQCVTVMNSKPGKQHHAIENPEQHTTVVQNSKDTDLSLRPNNGKGYQLQQSSASQTPIYETPRKKHNKNATLPPRIAQKKNTPYSLSVNQLNSADDDKERTQDHFQVPTSSTQEQNPISAKPTDGGRQAQTTQAHLGNNGPLVPKDLPPNNVNPSLCSEYKVATSDCGQTMPPGITFQQSVVPPVQPPRMQPIYSQAPPLFQPNNIIHQNYGLNTAQYPYGQFFPGPPLFPNNENKQAVPTQHFNPEVHTHVAQGKPIYEQILPPVSNDQPVNSQAGPAPMIDGNQKPQQHPMMSHQPRPGAIHPMYYMSGTANQLRPPPAIPPTPNGQVPVFFSGVPPSHYAPHHQTLVPTMLPPPMTTAATRMPVPPRNTRPVFNSMGMPVKQRTPPFQKVGGITNRPQITHPHPHGIPRMPAPNPPWLVQFMLQDAINRAQLLNQRMPQMNIPQAPANQPEGNQDNAAAGEPFYNQHIDFAHINLGRQPNGSKLA